MSTHAAGARALLLAGCLLALSACSTTESKVEGFNKRGQALLQRGDLVKARLEFQNALQLNPSAVPALFGLAAVAERSRDWPASYQLLQRVVELQPSHVEALVKIGKLQLAAGQLDKALATSEAAHALQPQSADVLGLRAALALKLGDAPKATALAKEAIARDRGHVDALVVLATERLQAGDTERGIAFLDHALAGHERNVALQMLKVQALEKAGQAGRIEEVLQKLVSLFPGEFEYRHLLASFYVAQGQPAKAEAEYRSVVAALPRDVAPKLQLVRFVHSAHGLAKATAELEGFARAEPKSAELKLALAQLRLAQKDDAAAIALWNEVVASGPDASGIRARGALAAYHLARRDREAARPLLAAMLAKDARDEQALFLRAGIAIDERRLEDAVGDLRTILRDTPESPRAHLLLAHAHELQGASDLASQHLASAAKASRYEPAYALPYARLLLRTGHARQAEGVLRELLRTTPGEPAGVKLLAETYLRLGDVAAAQALADQVGKTAGAEVTARRMQGAVQLARRDFASGIASYKEAHALAPADPEGIAAVVRSYLVAGQPAQAEAFVQAVVAAAPQRQDARLMLGQLRLQSGNTAGAVEALQEAIRLNPANGAPYQVLVTAHLARQDPTAALKAADDGLRAAPGHAGLRMTRAAALHSAGQVDAAIAAYEAILAERPNAAIVANNLASLLADHRQDAASVRRAFDLAQRFRGTDNPHLKDTLGWTMHLAGRHEEAAAVLKAAAAQAPELAVVHYHYGMTQIALNNVPVAREALRRSVELSQASPFAQVEAARAALKSL